MTPEHEFGVELTPEEQAAAFKEMMNASDPSPGASFMDMVGSSLQHSFKKAEEKAAEAMHGPLGGVSFDKKGNKKRPKADTSGSRATVEPFKARGEDDRYEYKVRAKVFNLHKNKDREEYEKIANATENTPTSRHIEWGTKGRCYVLLEWTERVEKDTSDDDNK